MVTPTSTLNGETWVDMATQAGFVVWPGVYLKEPEVQALSISGDINPAFLDQVFSAAMRLLALVPVSNSHIDSKELSGAGYPDQIMFSVATVDPEFLESIFEPAMRASETMTRRRILDQGFDAMVDEEIAQDQEIRDRVEQIAQTKRTLNDLEVGLEVLQDQLRGEREALRPTYRYVANDREL